jgi:hypothetical protein
MEAAMSRLLALFWALLVASAAVAEELPAGPAEQIGRLASVSGAVTYQATPQAPAATGTINTPLTSGNRITTAPRAHATIDIAAGRFYLDGDSTATVGTLGRGIASVAIEKGAVILRILPGGAGQVFIVATPFGKLRADQPGYFEVEVATGTGVVTISALEGGAQFNESTVLAPGTRATIAQSTSPVLEPAAEDDFLRRVVAEVAEASEDKLEAPSHISPQITGFQELQRHGLWVATEQYGWAWEPQVASDWRPFRDGRWLEIAPWGRTWIDNAPWGFAPAHYGSWAEVNSRWVWVPGTAAQATAEFSGAKTKRGDRAGGWVALGPEEPSPASSPVIINNVRVITQPVAPKIVTTTTVNNTTNVTTVVKEDRQPSVVFFGGGVPSTPPPSPPPSAPPSGVRNLTGLGAAGAPMGGGVAFPGTR